ncbi:hypothetical protein [Rhodococcus wratislaviensis]|uniref:DUF4352 domain-containing protein n=1 Tax=Rhodococcus wratislaviensis NBRC 100605 TaxID=1219028 RepID=X0PZW4_RHOWR|nr:hypothetical protein [Rhodococcus wratislaviensis]GAF49158.1 hypothetical protein RW1_069_00260 [Rhodococcus wratislaviensis NBRC 100605]
MTQPPPPPYYPPPPPGYPYGPPPHQPPKKKKYPWVRAVVTIFVIGVIMSALASQCDTTESSNSSSRGQTVATERTDPTVKDPATYAAISARDYALIVKDPAANAGRRIILYADVTQFDSATGPTTFRADTVADPEDDSVLSGTNTIVRGDKDMLAPIVQGDQLKLYAEIVGAEEYNTAMGGAMTVPSLQVHIVETVSEPN